MDVRLPQSAEKLPLHLAKIDKAARAGIGMPQLEGMIISGSFALGIADAYSDVDLKLVTTDEGYDDVADALDRLIDGCGRVVARFSAEHTGLPELTIVLYDDLVHVDFLPVRLSELYSKNAGMPALILWDRSDRVARELDRPSPPPSPVDLEWIERRVWTWFWYLQSKVLRGEIYEALDGLAWLRATVLFPLLGATRATAVAGARRIEPLLKELASDFAATSSRSEGAEVMEALRATARLYELLADPLLEKNSVATEDAARRVVRAALGAGLDWRPTDAPPT